MSTHKINEKLRKRESEKEKERRVCVCVKRAKHEFNHEIELLHKCNNLLLPLYFSYSIVGGFFPYCVPFHSPSLASSSRLTFLISLPPCLPASLLLSIITSATRVRLANVRKCAFFSFNPILFV